jgi:D-alanine-D-alanine ligase
MSKHVAVLIGGWSVEREVSLVSGAAVIAALETLGYRVTGIDADRDLAEALRRTRPDVVFNALHGRFGEDGCIQGLLETLDLPYTHSGVLASAMAMNKPVAKRLFKAAGIPVVEEWCVVDRARVAAGKVMDPPYVIKPLTEGSSVGVHIVLEGENFHPEEALTWRYGEEVMVERFVPGREIQVAMMGARALGAIELRPLGRFYDYEAKYTDGKTEHLMPAPLPPERYDEALRIGLAAHRALGCRGVTRADLRYDDTDGEPGAFFVLEINTQPGMTPLSLAPEIAAHAGIGFEELVNWMVEDAGCGR